MDIEPFLQLSLSNLQIYALFAILGSYLVATLSDLRYQSAQVEFLEVWVFFAFVALVIDIFSILIGNMPIMPIAVKWGLILIFSVLSHKSVGVYFHLATGDVFAAAAFSALLPIGLIVIFYVLLKIVNTFLKPILKAIGSRGGYPFMPVVLVSAGLVIALALWGLSHF